MTDASTHLPDTADQNVTDEDVTDELVAPEFIDAPENLPGDHAEPTNVRARRSPAAQVESERSV